MASEVVSNGHNFLSIITTCVLVALGIIGYMLRGWVKHVNDNLIKIWDRIDAEAKARECRWENLHNTCNLHGERISKLEGRLDGKLKILEGLKKED